MANFDPPLGDSGPDSTDLVAHQKRRKRWVLLVLLLLFGAAAVAVWRFALVPEPKGNRMLVLIQTEGPDGQTGAWWDSHGQASARCADELDRQLSDLGMELVKPGDPRTVNALQDRNTPDELREAARELEAGIVFTGSVKIAANLPLSGSDGLLDFTIEATLRLESTTDDAVLQLTDKPVRWHLAAPTPEEALQEACGELANRILPQLATKLREFGPIERLLDTDPGKTDLDQTVVVERLGHFWKLAHRWGEAEKARRKKVKQARESDAQQERGKLKKHLVGEFLTEEHWVGPGPEADLVIHTAPQRPVLADDMALVFTMEPVHQQLLRAGPDGKQRRVLFEASALGAGSSITPDGQWAAVVADHRKWSKAIHLVSVAESSSREVLTHRTHSFHAPQISPDGKWIVFWYSHSPDSDRSLELVGADGTSRKPLIPRPWTRMDLPQWAPDSSNLYVSFKGLEEPTASLLRIAIPAGTRTALLGAAVEPEADPPEPTDDAGEPDDGVEDPPKPLPSSFIRPAVSRDGRVVAVVEESLDGMWLGRYQPADQAYERLIEAPVGRLAISPDGKWIAFETDLPHADDARGGDREIALIASSGGEVRHITHNSQDDRLAGWSRDGTKLYFHQGSQGRHHIYWVEPASP